MQSNRSIRWDQAVIYGSAEFVVRMEVLNPGNVPGSGLPTTTSVLLDFDSAEGLGILTGSSITVSGGAAVTRTLSLKLADRNGTYLPRTIGDLLAPPNELRVLVGWRYDTGDTEFLPVGIFGISRPDYSDDGGGLDLTLTGYDRARKVQRAGWTKPFGIDVGTNFAVAIRRLIESRYPTATFNFAPTTSTTPPLSFGLDTDSGGDPWEDARKLAAADSRELFVDPGGVFVLREVPDADRDPVVWSYVGDQNSTILSVSRAFDDEPGYNGVVARSIRQTSTSGDQVQYVSRVFDNDPTSPTYWHGDWGRVPAFFTTQLATTQTQLDAAATALLRGLLGTEEEVGLSVVPNVAHEVGDVIEVIWQRPLSRDTTTGAINTTTVVAGRYVIDSLTIPLDGSAMTISCSRRRMNAGYPVGVASGPNDPLFTGTAPSPTRSRITGDPDTTSGKQYQAIYAIPSDAPDRVLDTNGQIVAAIDNLDTFTQLEISRSLRWTTNADGSEPAVVFARLPKTKAQYQGQVSTYNTLKADLQALGFNDPNKNYVVWFDGADQTAGVLGRSTVATTVGQAGIFVILYLGRSTAPLPVGNAIDLKNAPDADLYYADTALVHEVFHSLGAVNAAAPNHDATSPSHVLIAESGGTDIMGGNHPPRVIDFGSDDYYGHASGWLDTEDQTFWL